MIECRGRVHQRLEVGSDAPVDEEFAKPHAVQISQLDSDTDVSGFGVATAVLTQWEEPRDRDVGRS